ncbi:hypothetical protein BZG82_10345 [Salinivibrio sp. PR5]|uniref:NUDIX hydrolase n=1 Tax=Salinivibrio sp. PR5 TaxID=1909484 RepID=UPI00098A96E8|nr:NUDIX hydrolase [Salinivibrio sp. PR5]OOF09646.1 hypothetical protein BZG82_10345 [Salinivibrio sp. PR5]
MKETIYHQWKRLSLVETQTVLPDGRPHRHHVIRHPAAAVILPILEDGRLVLLNQFRPAVNQWLLEAPAGTLERDECPLEGAKRELEEETGCQATSWYSLGSALPVPGFCDEVQHFYLASGLTQTEMNLDDDEFIQLRLMTMAEARARIAAGEINDNKTVALIARADYQGLLPQPQS